MENVTAEEVKDEWEDGIYYDHEAGRFVYFTVDETNLTVEETNSFTHDEVHTYKSLGAFMGAAEHGDFSEIGVRAIDRPAETLSEFLDYALKNYENPDALDIDYAREAVKLQEKNESAMVAMERDMDEVSALSKHAQHALENGDTEVVKNALEDIESTADAW